jgi:hypothetical protein
MRPEARDEKVRQWNAAFARRVSARQASSQNVMNGRAGGCGDCRLSKPGLGVVRSHATITEGAKDRAQQLRSS